MLPAPRFSLYCLLPAACKQSWLKAGAACLAHQQLCFASVCLSSIAKQGAGIGFGASPTHRPFLRWRMVVVLPPTCPTSPPCARPVQHQQHFCTQLLGCAHPLRVAYAWAWKADCFVAEAPRADATILPQHKTSCFLLHAFHCTACCRQLASSHG